MRDEPARHHVGAVADARGIVPDGGGRDAEPSQVIEPGDPGLVAPDPGIVEDRRGDAQLGREIGGVDAAVGAVDDDSTRRLGPDAGDAVGGQDRRQVGQRSLPYRGDPTIMPSDTGGEQAGTRSAQRTPFPCGSGKLREKFAIAKNILFYQIFVV